PGIGVLLGPIAGVLRVVGSLGCVHAGGGLLADLMNPVHGLLGAGANLLVVLLLLPQQSRILLVDHLRVGLVGFHDRRHQRLLFVANRGGQQSVVQGHGVGAVVASRIADDHQVAEELHTFAVGIHVSGGDNAVAA